MQPIMPYRQASVAKHPPYGLFLDPHRGRHNWTAVNAYILLGLLAIVGLLGGVLAVVAR